MTKVNVIYFSPSGTTEKTAKIIADRFEGRKEYHDILKQKLKKKVSVPQDELLILAVPVFGGRVPEYCLSSLKHIEGLDSPAVIVCVYGNRAYEDALAEMEDIVHRQGFRVLGAGAFVAQHSLFNHIAEGRPDEEDIKAMEEFGDKCAAKLAEAIAQIEEPKIPGNRPYRDRATIPLAPAGGRECTKCRTCVNICPTGAISGETPRKTDKNKCIGCSACVAHCPVGARKFSGPVYAVAAKKIGAACTEKKEAETYI